MILKRIIAYCIDYFIILLYAGILFLITYRLHKLIDKPLEPQEPILGNIISFFTLTLPVFLYFYIFESSTSKKGTLGKKIMNIIVANNSKKNIFKRVFLKLLPWEIAHIGIHWSVYYNSNSLQIPIWVWIINIVPQIIAFSYFISFLLSRGKSSLYDKIANTSVIERVL